MRILPLKKKLSWQFCPVSFWTSKILDYFYIFLRWIFHGCSGMRRWKTMGWVISEWYRCFHIHQLFCEILKDAQTIHRNSSNCSIHSPLVVCLFARLQPKKAFTLWSNLKLHILRFTWSFAHVTCWYIWSCLRNWGSDRICRRILKHNLHAFVFGIWP